MTRSRRESKTRRQLYKSYEDLPIWRVVSKSVAEPVDSGDLRETTAHAYVVGYVRKSIGDAKRASS
jgi:hypothetical protein